MWLWLAKTLILNTVINAYSWNEIHPTIHLNFFFTIREYESGFHFLYLSVHLMYCTTNVPMFNYHTEILTDSLPFYPSPLQPSNTLTLLLFTFCQVLPPFIFNKGKFHLSGSYLGESSNEPLSCTTSWQPTMYVHCYFKSLQNSSNILLCIIHKFLEGFKKLVCN